MKTFTWVLLGGIFAGVIGCSPAKEKLQTYLDEPETLLQDPAFADYEQKSGEVESAYLNKEITYAEYEERKGELEKEYTIRTKRPENIVVAPTTKQDPVVQTDQHSLENQ